ncbi:ThiF family adenylyltransferase [Planctomycetota bacterium]
MLTEREQERYQRQMALPEWGHVGQEKLKQATVFIAGLGGLGSAVSLYLAAAGIGCLRLCDNQQVEVSNLNRQILYREVHIAKSKAAQARGQLLSHNGDIKIVACEQTIKLETLTDLIEDADILVDCLDNYQARMALNAVAVKRGLPLVHGGVSRWFGQCTFIHPPETPCLRCLFDDMQEEVTPPIVGAVAGVIGNLQALEVMKHLTECGTLLKNRMLYWDGEGMTFQERLLRKTPDCPQCELG